MAGESVIAKGKKRSGVRRVLWIGGGLAVGVAAGFVLLRPSSKAPSALPPPAEDRGGAERLIGRWLRPDGGYVLEFRGAGANGSLEASYFNPRPINVSRAEWRSENGRLGVFVELRDVNYPGSTYTLRYVPEQDRLVGAYFQAALRQNFEVVFIRRK